MCNYVTQIEIGHRFVDLFNAFFFTLLGDVVYEVQPFTRYYNCFEIFSASIVVYNGILLHCLLSLRAVFDWLVTGMHCNVYNYLIIMWLVNGVTHPIGNYFCVKLSWICQNGTCETMPTIYFSIGLACCVVCTHKQRIVTCNAYVLELGSA